MKQKNKTYFFDVTIKESASISAKNKAAALEKLKEGYLENSNIELEDSEIKYTGYE